MDQKFHDLLHALTRLEKYHEEQKRYIEIVNKLVNDMVLREEENDRKIDTKIV